MHHPNLDLKNSKHVFDGRTDREALQLLNQLGMKFDALRKTDENDTWGRSTIQHKESFPDGDCYYRIRPDET